jgi:hypothetical protein
VYRLAIVLESKLESTFLRPFAPSLDLSAGSSITRLSAIASSVGEPGATSKPVSSDEIMASGPPLLVATTGMEHAIASMQEIEKPSVRELKTYTSRLFKKLGTSEQKPKK